MHNNNVESQIQREAGSSLSIRADGALSRSPAAPRPKRGSESRGRRQVTGDIWQ